MKTVILLFLLALPLALAQWQIVGQPGFSTGQIQDNNIAVDPLDNQPAVILKDLAYTPAQGRKYNDQTSSWNVLGSGGTNGQSFYLPAAYDDQGRLWTAAREYYYQIPGDGVIGMWEQSWTVSQTHAAPDDAHDVDLDARAGRTVIAYNDRLSGSSASNDALTVQEYDVTTDTWTYLGPRGFYGPAVTHSSVKIASDGTVYSAARGPGGVISVFSHDDTSNTWTQVGQSIPGGLNLNLVLDNNDNPIVAYFNYPNTIEVLFYNPQTNSWNQQTASGNDPLDLFSSTNWRNVVPLAIDPTTNEVLVGYVMQSSKKMTVRRYDGSTWNHEGLASFTAGAIQYPSLAVASNGDVFVSFRDDAFGGKATVMKHPAQQTNVELKGTGCSTSGSYPSPQLDVQGIVAASTPSPITITGTIPNHPVKIYAGPQLDPPAPLGLANCEVWLDMNAMIEIAELTTDANGNAQINAFTPAGTSGIPISIQALSLVLGQEFVLTNAAFFTIQ